MKRFATGIPFTFSISYFFSNIPDIIFDEENYIQETTISACDLPPSKLP